MVGLSCTHVLGGGLSKTSLNKHPFLLIIYDGNVIGEISLHNYVFRVEC